LKFMVPGGKATLKRCLLIVRLEENVALLNPAVDFSEQTRNVAQLAQKLSFFVPEMRYCSHQWFAKAYIHNLWQERRSTMLRKAKGNRQVWRNPDTGQHHYTNVAGVVQPKQGAQKTKVCSSPPVFTLTYKHLRQYNFEQAFQGVRLILRCDCRCRI
jgi:hypothetical protein